MGVRIFALIAALIALPGCGGSASISFDFGIGASNRSPVLVTVMEVDGTKAYPAAAVRFSGAEGYPRQQGATSFGGPSGESFIVRAEWTEILTGRSYLGEAQVQTGDLAVENGVADLVVLLLAGGQMIVGSDPVPKTTKVETRDIAEICAARQPSKDRVLARKVGNGFEAAPDAPALVGRALEFVKDPLIVQPCEPAG